jgi:AAA+ ATPase superfamily predicted ATPase
MLTELVVCDPVTLLASSRIERSLDIQRLEFIVVFNIQDSLLTSLIKEVLFRLCLKYFFITDYNTWFQQQTCTMRSALVTFYQRFNAM